MSFDEFVLKWTEAVERGDWDAALELLSVLNGETLAQLSELPLEPGGRDD